MARIRSGRWTLVTLAILVTVLGLAGAGLADATDAGPTFTVSVDEQASDDAAWQGGEWTIAATVTNRGDELGTQDVVVRFGDDAVLAQPEEDLLDPDLDLPLSGPGETEVREVTLEPGESRSLELTPTVPKRVQPGGATATVLTADDAARLEGTVGDASVDVDPAVADDQGRGEVVVRLQPMNLEGMEDPHRVERALKAHADASQEDLLTLAERSEALEVRNTFWLMNGVLLEVDHDADGLLLASTADHVTRIHENFQMEPLADPGDTTASGSATPTSTSDTTWGLSEINAPDVWDQYGTRGSGARVAVLDTGIDADHDDLDLFTNDSSDPTYPGGWAEWDTEGNRIEGSEPYDADGHGTHVSGTVAGGAASGTHIGVAPDVELLHGGVLTPESQGYYSAVVAGMQWAAEREADVTSMSLGSSGYDSADIEPVRASNALGTYVVAAIGNDGEGTSGSPGNVYDSLAAGASDSNHDIASFSGGEEIVTDDSWGDNAPDDWPSSYVVPDLAAPGVDVYSSVPGDDYAHYSGTSMATPHVSGTVALLLSVHDHLDVDEVEEALRETAWKPSGEPDGTDTRYGDGIVDAKAAVDYASNHLTGFDVVVTGTNSPVTEGENLTVTATVSNVGDASETQTITLQDFQGATVDSSRNVSLSPGESTTVELTWATGDGDAGSHEVTVASEDLDDDELVRVFDDEGGCEPRHPVNIVGDWAFTAANGVTQGQGTAEDPYVIERWCVDAEDDTYAVFLDGTTAHVEVRGNQLRNSYGGVAVVEAENVSVTDNTIESNVARGISIYESPGTVAEDNTVRNNGWTGVTVWPSSPGTTLRGNELVGSPTSGTWIGSDGNNVTGNTVHGNDFGVSIGSAGDDNVLRDNEVRDNTKHGVFVDGVDNEVAANTVTGNGWQGVITWDQASGTTVHDNRIEANDIRGILVNGGAATVENNTVRDNGWTGVSVFRWSNETTIRNNEVTGNDNNGVWVNSLRNEVEGNTIEGNGLHGLSMGSSTGDTRVQANRISSNAQDGIWMGADTTTVADNEVVANGDDGLILPSGADGNTLTGNRIADQEDIGVWANAEDNRIRGNTIAGNGDGVVLSTDAAANNVTGNEVTANADDGIWLFGDDNGIDDNTVRDNDGTGVGLSSGATGNELVWNTIDSNGFGVAVFGTSDVTIERNEILRSEHDGLSANDLATPLDVTENAWGALDGPSGGVQDCSTGATADGDGDAIDADNAEVCFDPWLPPRFQVSVQDTNSPVLPGQDLEVTVEVENTWNTPDTQTLWLQDFSEQTVDRVEDVTVDGGKTATRTLVWETGTYDVGYSDVTVFSESHSVEEQVAVLPDPVGG